MEVFPSVSGRSFVLLLNDKTPDPYSEFIKLRVVELDQVEGEFDQILEVVVAPPEGCQYIKGYEICSCYESGYMVCGTARGTFSRDLDIFIYTFNENLQNQKFEEYSANTGPLRIDPDFDEMGGDISSNGHFFTGGVRYRYLVHNFTDFYVVFEPNRFALSTNHDLPGEECQTRELDEQMRGIRVETLSRSGSSYCIILENSSDPCESVVIYDISGREVKELLNPVIQSNNAYFSFDGRDSNGRLLPEGIYLFVPRGLGSPGVSHPILRH